MKLSILICSLKSRERQLSELLDTLLPQCGKPTSVMHGFVEAQTLTEYRHHTFKNVEVHVGIDSKRITTGKKRNILMGMAKGDYVVFIDDDDMVPNYYIAEILEAIRTKPDCVGINGTMTTNGKDEKKWYISRDYTKWETVNDVYIRTPNHLAPIKRSIALKVPFPDTSSGEDSAFSKEIHHLLKTETKISKPMYLYRFSTHKR